MTPHDSPKPAPSACPICAGEQFECIGSRDGYSLYECKACTHRTVSPMPSEAELAAVYHNHEYFGGELVGGYSDYDAQTEPTLSAFTAYLDEIEALRPPGAPAPVVIDIGCALGTHLALAASRGWIARGVEVSDHARKVADERHGNSISVGNSIASLPHEPADLIVLNDVVEHFAEPHKPFHQLFQQKCISPQTRIYLTTPNAGSEAARKEGVAWKFFHPPIHLHYFTETSLRQYLENLGFHNIEISGLYAGRSPKDEHNRNVIAHSAALQATASGSNFAAFIKERYVPGTWSRITAYEHLPRYELAKLLARPGCRALDFGTGSGFGAAILAPVCELVTGIDIDKDAIQWARNHYGSTNLRFEIGGDLGASLPEGAYQIITCFELVEHITREQQQELSLNLARCLDPKGGICLVSTPNPKITSLYDENPFHIAELELDEFENLLRKAFPHVLILCQQIAVAVRFATGGDPDRWRNLPVDFRGSDPATPLSASGWVALCSHKPIPEFEPTVSFDTGSDYITDSMLQHQAWKAQLERSRAIMERSRASKERIAELRARIANLRARAPGEQKD